MSDSDYPHADRFMVGVAVLVVLGLIGLAVNGIAIIISSGVASVAWKLSIDAASVATVLICSIVTAVYLVGFTIDKAFTIAERWSDA